MNRRTSLARMFGQQQQKVATKPMQTTNVSLNPYQGAWTLEQAAHLLRRTTFGPTPTQIKEAVRDGLEGTIAKLFAERPTVDPPIYFNYEDDPNVPNGETWINHIEDNDIAGMRAKRRQSLLAWVSKNIYESGQTITIREKMTLFWMNHFVVSNPVRSRMFYEHNMILRNHALGDFKKMTAEITVNAAMLVYLNGNQNSKNAPNENYSRELLELFTIGKGPLAGPGDYTNYTEQDVAELARALTGWRFYTNNDRDPSDSVFLPNRHDTGAKQLSHRFDNVVITDGGAEEYKTVIDIIFQKAEVARFISRKIYAWFLHSTIDSEVETHIIEPMAQLLIANNYEIQPTVAALVTSEHFYDQSFRGCMVNHPADFYFKLVNTFGVEMPADPIEQYYKFLIFNNNMKNMEMAMFYAPTVAGWKAFYQAPQYSKIWISSVTLPLRQNYSDRFVRGFNSRQLRTEIDVINFVAQLDNPTDPNDMISELATFLFSQPITEAQLIALKRVILPAGFEDYNWTEEYSNFIGGDESLRNLIEDKLKALIKTMLRMPEFYLV
ncbi:MAG: DUF1800 family protein [Saprospiraceae bacterium]